MSQKTAKPKRKTYFLNSPVELIDIDKIITDESEKQSAVDLSADNEIVKRSVRLYNYDEEAPPLLVFKHQTLPNCYSLLDGYKRMEGARENGSVKQLPCIVVEVENLDEAQLIAAKYNAPVYDIREKKNLAFHIIETLNKIYKRRKLTKDLSLRNEELLHLIDLSGESETTCNRALAVFRGIFSELISKNPDCADAGLKNCFLDAIESKKYPELEDFYKKGTSVLSFSDRFFERVNKTSPGMKKANRQQKQKTTRVARMPESVTDAYTITAATGNKAHKTEANIAATPISLHSNTDNPEIEFLNQLKAMSSIDKIDLSAAKELIQDFLLNNSESKTWVNLFFNCVRLHWRKLKLTVINEPRQVKDLQRQQSLNLTSIDNALSEDNQPFVLTP